MVPMKVNFQFKAGDKVRLRISNAGASSYFLAYLRRRKNHGRSNDGNDVEPVEVDRLLVYLKPMMW
jgi:FtsP/CotA-like multicopper oxidase with cupredoxin domain